jgi:hypothetical protein
VRLIIPEWSHLAFLNCNCNRFLLLFLYKQKIPNEIKDSEPAKNPAEASPDEDNRFEIPTDQSMIQPKNANEVIYSDGVVPNSNTNNSELFSTQSNDLDTRLK